MKTRLRLINKSFLLKESNIQFIGKITNLDKNVWYDEEGNLTVLDEFESENFKRELIKGLFGKYVLLIQINSFPCYCIGQICGNSKTTEYENLILENGIIRELTGKLRELPCLSFCINSNVIEIIEISEEEFLKIKENKNFKINHVFG